MSDLVEFLRARLDEDEAVARCGAAELGGTWTADQVNSTEGAAAHIARWDPARVLAEVEAKRRAIERCRPIAEMDGWEYSDAPDLAGYVLLALAQPYSDLDDFAPAWRLR